MANEKKRILIIDDEEPICFALSTILKEKGHEVDACETGGAGLEKLMEKSYNLILLDYNLPDMDGLRVAERARELDKDVSIVFISAYGTTDVIVRAERVTKATLHAHPPEDICMPALYSIAYRILKMIPDRVGAGAIELMKGLLDRTLPGKTLA